MAIVNRHLLIFRALLITFTSSKVIKYFKISNLTQVKITLWAITLPNMMHIPCYSLKKVATVEHLTFAPVFALSSSLPQVYILELSSINLYMQDSFSSLSPPLLWASPVDVVLPVGGQVIVDDQRHLLHINASGQQVSRNQHTGGARAELTHDHVSFLLVHVTML